MISARETKYLILFFLILIAIGVFMYFGGLTFLPVDQIYCRNYYPWKALNPKLDCSQYRSGDDIFENNFTATELDYLKANPYQQSYSERIMNGYPIADAYSANRYSLQSLFSYFLPATSSNDFTTLILIFVGFTIGYLIARSLDFSSWYAIIFGLLSITPAYVSLFESFNMVLIGFELIVLGMLQFYKFNRKRLFIFLVFGGSLLILLSAIYQFYLYAALSFVLLGFIYFNCDNKKRFLILWAASSVLFLIAVMFLNFFLEGHASFLLASNKLGNNLSLSELIKHKDYSIDPLGWIGQEPVKADRKLVALIFGNKFGYEDFGAVTVGTFSPGLAFLVLFFIGATALFKKYRGYVLIAIFWLLYFAGYLQFLLSLLPGPFRSETSIRASNIFFLLATLAAVYALRGLFSSAIVLGHKAKFFIYLVFGYVIIISSVLIVFRNQKHDQFLLEAFYGSICSIIFIIGFYLLNSKHNFGRKKLLAIILISASLILPNISRLFLGVPTKVLEIHPSSLYFPETTFQKELEKYSDINRVAVIQTQAGQTTHPNGPDYLGLETITGDRNPLFKDYDELYQYHSLIFEGDKNPSRSFASLIKSADYLEVASPPLMTPASKIKLSEATQRYFRLLGVDAIIGSEDLVINDKNWEKLTQADGLSLWRSKTPVPQMSFAADAIVINERLQQLQYIFENQNWNIDERAVVNQAVSLPNDGGNKKVNSTFEIIKRADGYRLIQVQVSGSGILTLPLTYNKHWQAIWTSAGSIKPMQIIESDYAFVGIVVPKGQGNIELVYKDKPVALNYTILYAGLVMLIGVILLAGRFL